MHSTFLDKVKSTIKKYNMLHKYDKVLVGLSGGADSVTLLHILYLLRKEYLLDIIIAHLDHKFRGDESMLDRRFCEGLALKYKLRIISDEIDVPKISRDKGISAEEAARIERYEFFKRLARGHDIKSIAVGHTKNDQAETVLMRILRGAGALGLGGMSPVKDMQGTRIIRPLIEISRREIEEFITENNLKFRQDSSNIKTVFTRNKIRLELLPFLERDFNPNMHEVLVNMAENLRIENEFLTKFSDRKFKGMARIKSNEILLDIKKLRKQHEAIRKRILRAALKKIKGDTRTLTYQHWKEIEDLMSQRPVKSKVNLPVGLTVVKDRANIVISRE